LSLLFDRMPVTEFAYRIRRDVDSFQVFMRNLLYFDYSYASVVLESTMGAWGLKSSFGGRAGGASCVDSSRLYSLVEVQ
jgi:hypothetical protein